MKKNEEIFVKELLKPLKHRPSLNPRKEFVLSVKKQLENQQIQKTKRLPFKPVILMILTAFCLFIFVSTIDFNKYFGHKENESFTILEQEQFNQLITIDYGEDSDQ